MAVILKPAHELKVGDHVWYDAALEAVVVTDVFASDEGDMVDVLYDNGRGAAFARTELVRVEEDAKGGESRG